MLGKSNIDVLKNVKKTALDEEISRYVAYHRYYQRLIAIRIISEGHSIAEVARITISGTKLHDKWLETYIQKVW